MKICRALVILCLVQLIDSERLTERVLTDRYARWKSKYHNKTDESKVPYGIFRQTLRKVARSHVFYYTNRIAFKLDLNFQAADTPEVRALKNAFKVDVPIDAKLKRPSGTFKSGGSGALNGTGQQVFIPGQLDYRELGLVTHVEDQGVECGSCYAFAAACALEGQYMKARRELKSFSKQNMVDCTRQFGNNGCDGGNMASVYNYIRLNQGIANETTYPYMGTEKNCNYSPDIKDGNVFGYTFVRGDEEVVKRALANVGPLAIAMKSDLDSFYYYGGGIYSDAECTPNPNHAVCLVGYGTDNTTNPPTDYWIVKNSWSEYWGEGGFIRVKMGSNMCGITSYVIYPLVF